MSAKAETKAVTGHSAWSGPKHQSKKTINKLRGRHKVRGSKMKKQEAFALKTPDGQQAVVDDGEVGVAETKKSKQAVDGKSTSSDEEVNDFLGIGDTIEDYLHITSKISEGGFGQVYTAIDTKNHNREVAIKAENGEYATTTLELYVLTLFQGHPNCPRVYDAGRTRYFTYLSMQLLGRNLSQIRRCCKFNPARMTVPTVFGAIVQCLQAVEGLHKIGFLHRDIKPSNFAIGAEKEFQRTIYILDFGLARKYIDSKGAIKPARSNVGFRGTVRYASIRAHQGADLSCRDDIVSCFFMFVELISGCLPWRNVVEKDAVRALKEKYPPKVFFSVFPTEVARFVELFERLSYGEAPDYKAMIKCFLDLLQCHGVWSLDELVYEWQYADCRQLVHWCSAAAKQPTSDVTPPPTTMTPNVSNP